MVEACMDHFLDKSNQRLDAQETIKANFMAEVAEKEELKKQLAENGAVLQSVRNLYLKQEENMDLLADIAEKLDALAAQNPSGYEELLKECKQMQSKNEEFTHKECVKVYRNVQAVLQDQNERLLQRIELLEQQLEEVVEGISKRSEVSALMTELEETKSVAEKARKSIRSNKVLLVFAVLFGIANMACVLLIHFGLL